MATTRQVLRAAATVTALVAGGAPASIFTSAEPAPSNDAEAATAAAAAHPPKPAGAIFFENFDGDAKSRFHLSNKDDYVGQDVQVRTVEGRWVRLCVTT
jgi:hypothetical protein